MPCCLNMEIILRPKILYNTTHYEIYLLPQFHTNSAVADKPARRGAALCPQCCTLKWMLSVINWQWSSVKLSWKHLLWMTCHSEIIPSLGQRIHSSIYFCQYFTSIISILSFLWCLFNNNNSNKSSPKSFGKSRIATPHGSWQWALHS